MRVAVLGAAGTIAAAIVRDLGESPEVDELLLLDRDRPRAEVVAAEQAADKSTVAALDAPDGLAAALAGCQVLVNAASYRGNLEAMEAALDAGCHYVDLGGLYWMTARQIELDERFIAADLLAVLGMGGSPGKTSVMALLAVQKLDGAQPLEIHVSAAARDPAAGDGGLRLPDALRTLIDELTLPPVVLEEGAARELAPLASGGVVDFPVPIGPAETIHTLHSELQTFGRSFRVPRASFRLALPPPLLSRLQGLLGATDDELAAVAAASLPPSNQAIAGHVVEASSAGRTVRVSALSSPMTDWGLGGGVVSTAAPAAAVVRLIAAGKIDAVGAIPPEACVEPEDLLPELERRGCAFTLEISELG